MLCDRRAYRSSADGLRRELEQIGEQSRRPNGTHSGRAVAHAERATSAAHNDRMNTPCGCVMIAASLSCFSQISRGDACALSLYECLVLIVAASVSLA